jgi:O-antigen/teichoic acid export membrane protein
MSLVIYKKFLELFHKYSHINFSLADQAMVSGVNFLTTILLARALGPKDFGVFTLAWFVVLFLSSLQFALISAPMMSIGPKQSTSRSARYFGSVFAQQAVFASVSAIIVLIGAWLCGFLFPDWGVERIAVPMAFATGAYQARDFVRRYYFTRGRFGSALLFDTATYGTQLGLLGWLAFRGQLEVAYPLWIVLISAGVGIVGAASGIGALSWHRTHFIVIARRHWRFSRWLGASAVLQVISSQIYLIASGFILGTAAVGILRASQNLMGLAQILFFGLQNVIPGRAGNWLRTNGIDGLVAYVKRTTWALELATGAIVCTFAITPEFWLSLIFGDQFGGNGHLVRWYAATYMVVALSFPLTGGLWALESTRPIFLGYATATVIGFAAAYPLLTYGGVVGAAAGVLMTQVVMVCILFLGFLRRISAPSPTGR